MIIGGLLFLIFSVLSFTFPGVSLAHLVGLDSKSDLERLSLGTAIGVAIFTLSAYILAILDLRFLMWIFPVVGLILLIKWFKLIRQLKWGIDRPILKYFLIILIIGVISQVSVNAFSGLYRDNSLVFYSSHGHDGLWHISLIEQFHKDIFPFQNPELAGYKLQNYHFFVDLLMSEVTRMIPVSALDVYFRFMPILFSILLGTLSFCLVSRWTKSQLSGLWAMIFIYFSGSFGYFLTLFRAHNLSGSETLFWVSQTPSILGNPPHAAAFTILLASLILVLVYLEKPTWRLLVLISIIAGSIIEFKVYGGVLLLGGLLMIGLYNFAVKRQFNLLGLFGGTALVSAAIYLPNSANSQDFLIWEPWWFIRTMVVATDRLNWLDLELKRQTYIADHNYKRVAQVELTALLIFLVGNLGTRIIGFVEVFNIFRKNIFKNPFGMVILSMTAAAFLIPTLFVQKGVAWNAIQFDQYFLLLFGLLAAVSTGQLICRFKSPALRIIISGVIILLSFPTQIGLLYNFYANKPLSQISSANLAALNYLKAQTPERAIILTAPFDANLKSHFSNPPIPIYAWYDTGYVSAFSARSTLFADEEQVGIMGYKVDRLFLDRQTIFDSTDAQLVNGLLKLYNVGYIYLVGNQTLAALPNLNIKLVFQSKDSRVFQVNE